LIDLIFSHDYSLAVIEWCILNLYSLIYSNFSHLLMVMISVTQDETGVLNVCMLELLKNLS
jgi:hypothetical protein